MVAEAGERAKGEVAGGRQSPNVSAGPSEIDYRLGVGVEYRMR